MPKNVALCFPHKRTVDAMFTQYNTLKKKGMPQQLDKFQAIRAESTPLPPSPFSNAVMKFEINSPKEDGNNKRKFFDIIAESGKTKIKIIKSIQVFERIKTKGSKYKHRVGGG